MGRKKLARKAVLVTALSGGVDQVSTAPHKLHANCSDQVVEAMRNSSASRREMVIQPLRQLE